mgnify:CR=1 FL=1
MPIIDIEISEEIERQMKKYDKIDWNKVLKKKIKEFLKRLEKKDTISIERLREKLEESGFNMEDLSHERNIELFKKMREAEWNRTYSTRTY